MLLAAEVLEGTLLQRAAKAAYNAVPALYSAQTAVPEVVQAIILLAVLEVAEALKTGAETVVTAATVTSTGWLETLAVAAERQDTRGMGALAEMVPLQTIQRVTPERLGRRVPAAVQAAVQAAEMATLPTLAAA